MNRKLIMILIALVAIAGVVYYGRKLMQGGNETTAQLPPPPQNALLSVNGDTLKLTDSLPLMVLFDTLDRLKPASFTVFDTLLYRTDLYSNSQLNFNKKRNLTLNDNPAEKPNITAFMKKTGMDIRHIDTFTLRQLVFRVVLDSVRNAAKARKAIIINGNKEIVYADAQPAQPPPAAQKSAYDKSAVLPLIIAAAILSLLAIVALFFNNNPMAKAAKKKRSETDEEYLKRTVYDMLGKDTQEARYFTEVLAGNKHYQLMKDQLKPEGKPDTGTLINNMKNAGLLTAGESKTMYELYELKEKVSGMKNPGTGGAEKQQHLLQLLQSMTKDEELKAHLKQAENEGVEWQRLMNLDEQALPGALQNMIRFYDDKYGNGGHKLSPVYAETLRRAQLDIPENFSDEDRFLKALYEKYRNLLDDVLYTWFGQQQSEEKMAEARQSLVNRMAQLAFHAHSFLTHYNKDVSALPPSSIRGNMQMIVQDGTVPATLNRDAYKTYSRDITKFEREIFLQKLLTGIGVNNLENVLVKDVYYPKDSLEQ